MNKNNSKITFMDKITNFTTKIAGPLGRVAEYPAIAAIQNGLVSIMPVIIVGSIFLILYVLGSPSVGTSGNALLPFLSPYAIKFVMVNSYTMGFMTLYCSVAIPMNYAEKIDVDVKAAAILGLATFIVFTSGMEGINTNAFSASGLFVCILLSIFSVKIYQWIVSKNLVIKLPDSVPPSIGRAFVALVPYTIIIALAWFVRIILNFDMVTWFLNVLTPFITAADNLFMYTFERLLHGALWSVGLHGDNMLTPIFSPFRVMWTAENAAALAAGNPLPHVWTNNGIDRISGWTATVWPLVFYMLISKVKHLKVLGFASLPSAIFTIVEPVIFGLPLALNPFLLIPFIVTGVVNGIFTYLMFSFNIVGRFYAELPWATPPFILGPLGTGDIKTLIVVAGSFLIGLVIYYPFWRLFEQDCLRKEAERELELEQSN